jgi:hypothetical protein
VYAGAWGGALPYFQGRLGLLPPPHTGLAEWFLSLLTAQGHSDSSSSSNSSGNDVSSHWSLDIVSGQADTGSSQQVAPLDLHAAWLDFQAADSSAGQAVVQCVGRQSAGNKGLQRECSLPVIKVVVDSEGEDECDDAGAPAQVEQPAQAAEEGVAEAEQPASAAAQQQIGHNGMHSSYCVAVEATLTCSVRQVEQQQTGQAGVPFQSVGSSHAGAGAGFWVQVGVLALRSLRWWWRNPAMIISGALRCMWQQSRSVMWSWLLSNAFACTALQA